MSALAFNQYLRFAGEGLAQLSGVAQLRAEMLTVVTLFITNLAAGVGLMSLLAGILVALQVTAMRAG
jgi:hypothetical protein